MKKLNNKQILIFQTGAILILIGVVLMITSWQPLAPYIYGVGAVGFSSMQMLARYEGSNIAIIRLRRQQLFGSILLLLTTIPMFMNIWHQGFAQRNEWIVCLTIAAWLQLYTSFRIASEIKKESSK